MLLHDHNSVRTIVYTKLKLHRNHLMKYVLKLEVMGHAFLVHQASFFSPPFFLDHQRMYCQAQVHVLC